MEQQIHVLTIEMMEKFQHSLYMEEKSQCTVAQYMRDVEAFFEFLPQDKTIDKQQVIAYKEHLILSSYSSASVNTKISALNKLFGFLGAHECQVKTVKTQRKMFCAKEKELTRSEYYRLLQAAKSKGNRRLHLLMQAICSTGIRISELKWITVQAVKSNRVEVTAKGKTRSVFLSPKLRSQLLQYAKEQQLTSGPVFVTKTGKALDRSNIWSDMKALCKAAGVEPSKVFPHNLRHLFARSFYAIEKDIFHLADVLGHSSVETTRLYTITSGDEQEKKICALGLVV